MLYMSNFAKAVNQGLN